MHDTDRFNLVGQQFLRNICELHPFQNILHSATWPVEVSPLQPKSHASLPVSLTKGTRKWWEIRNRSKGPGLTGSPFRALQEANILLLYWTNIPNSGPQVKNYTRLWLNLHEWTWGWEDKAFSKQKPSQCVSQKLFYWFLFISEEDIKQIASSVDFNGVYCCLFSTA